MVIDVYQTYLIQMILNTNNIDNKHHKISFKISNNNLLNKDITS